MPSRASLAKQRLGAVIDAIASDDISPGSGSAAAVGLALAAACAAKAVAITIRHQPSDPELMRAGSLLTEITQFALSGADDDATRFRAFMLDKSARSAEELLESGEHLQHLGSVLFAVIQEISERIDQRVAGDLAAARALCDAFVTIQSRNLAENRDTA
jgi:hypothetical protein